MTVESACIRYRRVCEEILIVLTNHENSPEAQDVLQGTPRIHWEDWARREEHLTGHEVRSVKREKRSISFDIQ